jgi:hypothetical protein
LSSDSGETFATHRVVDADGPLGRADVAFLTDGSVVVLWVASPDDDGTAEVRVRRYPASGEPAPAVVVTKISGTRASGFPRLVAYGDGALVAWTITDGPRLGVALLTRVR